MRRAAREAEVASAIGGAIESGKIGERQFTYLARALFAYQYEFNAPYRRFCDGRGVTPDDIASWRDIPAAPASAFKRFALICTPEEDCAPERGGRVFHSSGTTQAETSRHFLNAAALDLYRQSLTAGYAQSVPPTSAILALMPSQADAPHSSLSFMLGELGAHFFHGDQLLTHIPVWIRSQWKDYTLFGTAFAFVNLFDGTDGPLTLSEDCVVVETGGFKGRSREVSREVLYGMFADRFGVAANRSISEYGMSEMASQYYDSVALDAAAGIRRKGRKVGPPWLRTRILDPITGEDARPGQPGLLAHYDLANLNSVLAIQTEDLGIAADDGDGFTLLGRAPGAILRGCSLLAEG
jgi:hypothetical protein